MRGWKWMGMAGMAALVMALAAPADAQQCPKGKLRLLYEAAPLAFIVEQAGGMAVDGTPRRIMDVLPEDLHQRTPLVIGSRQNVEEYLTYVNNGR